MTNTATGIIRALNSGVKHLAVRRFTLKYPEEKLKFSGDGYQFDPSTGVGIAGLKGRHMLFHDHCTGCQLCSIACEGVAEAIAMVKVPEEQKQNKKSIMPQIDYGKCVFCGLCVDACPVLRPVHDQRLRALLVHEGGAHIHAGPAPGKAGDLAGQRDPDNRQGCHPWLTRSSSGSR